MESDIKVKDIESYIKGYMNGVIECAMNMYINTGYSKDEISNILCLDDEEYNGFINKLNSKGNKNV